jgi:hypothetical protein
MSEYKKPFEAASFRPINGLGPDDSVSYNFDLTSAYEYPGAYPEFGDPANAFEAALVMKQLRSLASIIRNPRGDQSDYFPGKAAEEYYRLSDELAVYAHDEGVGGIVLVDKSARPAYVGINEVWRARYPNEPRPVVAFMNQFGIEPVGEMTNDSVQRAAAENAQAGIVMPTRFRSKAEIVDEFGNTYKELIEH